MKRSSRYVVGWIDTTVHEFVRDADARLSAAAPYALITRIDSSPDLKSLIARSPELRPMSDVVAFVGDATLVPTRKLIEFERRSRIFFGFDEVWFFKRRPQAPKPDEVVMGAPPRLDAVPPSWLSWMDASGCALAFGDGEGMNFCAKVSGIASHLLTAVTRTHRGVMFGA